MAASEAKQQPRRSIVVSPFLRLTYRKDQKNSFIAWEPIMWINLESLGWIIHDLKFIRAEISRLMTVSVLLRLVDDARAIWFYLLDDCVAFI